MTRTKWTLFVLLFASYAYFYQAGGWNQNSRFALVRAITNEHTLNIDPFRLATGDKAFDNGHYYSDKAPGLALTAVPIVALARPFLRAFGGDPETYAGIALLSYLATVFTAGLFTAFAGVTLFTLCLDLGANDKGALFAAIVFGLGSPIWTLATIFIGHAFSGALLVMAFAAACRAGDGDWRHGAIAGVCAGWATVSEFPAAIPAVIIAAMIVVAASRLERTDAMRVVGALVAGALVTAAVLMIFQWACFGSPFHLAYSSEEGYVGMQQGIYGVNLPRLIRLRRILFGEYRGLLPLAPVLALAPIGWVVMVSSPKGPRYARDTRDSSVPQAFRPADASGTDDPSVARALRPSDAGSADDPSVAQAFRRADASDAQAFRPARMAAIAAAMIAVYYILLNASYAYWEGGWSYGPRHATPGIAFLCLGLAALWTAVPKSIRAALALVGAYGIAVTLVAVSTMPLPPNNIRRPVAELLWPAFVDGDLSLNTQTFVSGSANPDFRAHTEPKAAFNLGMKMGLRGLTSLLPLAVVWVGCGVALTRARAR